MTRQWQPGDVAMIRDRAGVEEVAYCFAAGQVGGHIDGQARWRVEHGTVWSSVASARPLVVIDPENREQVERLVSFYEVPFNGEVLIAEQWQAAFREFANPTPPKPDEPTGLGAVVEDADGGRWVRYTHRTSVDYAWRRPYDGRRFHNAPYDEIAVVRVLSEGIQP